MPPLPYSGDYPSAHPQQEDRTLDSRLHRSGIRSQAVPRSVTTGRTPHQQDVFYIGGYVLSKAGRLQEVLLGRKTRRGVKYAGTVPATAIQQPTKPLLQTLRLLGVYACEFANVPETPDESSAQAHAQVLTEERMHDCQWVEPSLKVMVRFEGWTASGHLHHPQLLTML